MAAGKKAQVDVEGEPRRRLSADARREQLLAAARTVFLRSGLGGTTVRDISDEAGVNIALLYRHFDSKEELFDEAIAQPLESALEGLVAMAGEGSGYIGRPDVQRALVAGVVQQLLEAMAEITPLLGVVLFSDRGAAFYREHMAPAIDTVAQATSVAQSNAEHRRYEPGLIATMMIGTCFAYGLRETFSGERLDHAATAAGLTDLLFDGVVPR